MTLRPGARLRSAVCATEVIVLRAPSADIELRCGGRPMLGIDAAATPGGAIDAAYSGGTQLGKRYTHQATSLEVLCTKGGVGTLSVGDEVLQTMAAKQLPSSD